MGKPSLKRNLCPLDIQFNLSHCEDMVVYAVGHGCDVGIDVEEVRPLPDLEDVAHFLFSPVEYVNLMRLPHAQKLTAFFNYWTRKEAYMKAVGTGLSGATKDFGVSLRPDIHLGVPAIDKEYLRDWVVHSFTPSSKHMAAVAYNGPDRGLMFRHFGSTIGAFELLRLQ